MADLRLIILAMKKALVKPRVNGRYHVIGSPEFFYDMISDPIVEKYMTINQTTKTMYDNSSLVPMFEMEFYETMLVPTSSEYVSNGKVYRRMYRPNGQGGYEYNRIAEDDATYVSTVDGYVKDARTGQDASYIPGRKVWDIAAWNAANKGNGSDWYELKAQHILIVGKDALTRTGLAGRRPGQDVCQAEGFIRCP